MYSFFKYHILAAFLGVHNGAGLPNKDIFKTISFKVSFVLLVCINYVESSVMMYRFHPDKIDFTLVSMLINFMIGLLTMMLSMYFAKLIAKDKQVLVFHFIFINIILGLIYTSSYAMGYQLSKVFGIVWVVGAMISNVKWVQKADGNNNG